jgi:hypothetical protein
VLCDRTRVPALGFFDGRPGATGEVLINGWPPAERDPVLRERDRLGGYAG